MGRPGPIWIREVYNTQKKAKPETESPVLFLISKPISGLTRRAHILPLPYCVCSWDFANFATSVGKRTALEAGT